MNYHFAKFYTNISTNMDTTNMFLFLAIFSIIFYHFTPKWHILDLFSLALYSTSILIFDSLQDRIEYRIENTE